LCSVCGQPLSLSGGDELDVLDLVYLSDDEPAGGDAP
jgi:hypothetical protein